MYFKLKILYKDNTLSILSVKRVVYMPSLDEIYYERESDVIGRGLFIEKKNIKSIECEPLSRSLNE